MLFRLFRKSTHCSKNLHFKHHQVWLGVFFFVKCDFFWLFFNTVMVLLLEGIPGNDGLLGVQNDIADSNHISLSLNIESIKFQVGRATALRCLKLNFNSDFIANDASSCLVTTILLRSVGRSSHSNISDTLDFDP